MGDWKFANLLSDASELASSEMRREKRKNISLDLALLIIIAKGLATYLQFIKTFHFCLLDSG